MTTTPAINLFFDQIRNLQGVENQLDSVLPQLASNANHRGLRHMIVKHFEESTQQRERLRQVLERYGLPQALDGDSAIRGMMEVGTEQIIEAPNVETRDLLLLVHFLRIERFEIASYENTAWLADQLGFNNESEMLAAYLAERDSSVEILKRLQMELLQLAYPMDIQPHPIFKD